MQEIEPHKITIDRLTLPVLKEKELEVDVLRLDKLHPIISGNKWFKLRYHLEAASKAQKTTILTFGGAWSNHILATAAVSSFNGMQSIGIIRGEEPAEFSATLQQAREIGMQLYFISRSAYSDKKIPAAIDIDSCYHIPEGGYDELGAAGAATIAAHYDQDHYTHICCAAGTGTMAAGLLQAMRAGSLIAVSVLKNHTAMENNIRRLCGDLSSGVRLQVMHDHHGGGYAKYNPELIRFMNEFYSATGIPTDFVYTAKAFFAVNELAWNDFFSRGSRVLLIHSGGLQGNASFGKGTLIF